RASRRGQGKARDQIPARQGNGGPGDIRSLRRPIRELSSLDRYVPPTMKGMRHRVLACDFDGTLAVEGVCSDETVEALQRVAAAGMRLVLVTGRTWEELIDVFDPGSLFKQIVVENGAVVIDSGSGQEQLLAPRVPPGLVAELQRTGVTPLIVGRVLCSTAWSQE